MDRPLIICFAGDRWDGNPHSRHHLMRRFAGDFEVLFIESLPMRSVAQADSAELLRIWQKLRGGIGLRTVEPHLHVLTPPPIPPAGLIGRAAQLAAVRGYVAYARRRLGLRGTAVSWFSVPIAAPLRSRLGDRGSLFYYQDRYEEFSHVDASRLRALTSGLARDCDATIATSAELAKDLRNYGAANPILVPHGVDVERFSGDPPPPDDLAELEHPLVGYVGILDDYLSLDSIRATAERLTRGTVVLVGRSNTDVSILEHPRIARLGFRPHDTIPAYLAAFACCIAPFQLTRLTTAVNPIKLREYLAAGRPVVSTPLPAVLEYAEVVELASEPAEFADRVIRALDPGNDTVAARRRRRERVREQSWDAVAAQIRPILLTLAGAGSPSGHPDDRPGATQGMISPCAES
ncbi:MAG: glycosyltransferase [Solirubrobacteraceae bacterium]